MRRRKLLTAFSFSGSKTVLSGGLERVLSWSARSGEQRESFRDAEDTSNATVTRLLAAPDGVSFAAGYSNGAVRVWGPGEGGRMEMRSVFTGHTKPVSAMCFNEDGSLLATGSQSTEVLVWDVLGQSGRARFKGHKGAVTGLRFAHNSRRLITSSKDAMVLVWDLTVQQCVQTLTGHRHEVWCLELDPSQRLLITGSSDNKLRVWRFDAESSEFKFYGAVDRSTESRVACIGFCSESRLVVQSVGKAVDVYALNDEATRAKKMKRRLKREKAKMEAKTEKLKETVGVPGFNLEAELAALNERYVIQPRASDELALLYSFSATHKLHRMATLAGKNTIALMTNRNEFQLFKIGRSEAKEVLAVDLPGHRSDIRALALNSNDSVLLTVSQTGAKMWSTESSKCLSTVPLSGNGLCALFLPLDKHAVVGTKEGKVELIAVASAAVVETVACHEGAVWDCAVAPNKKGIVTGGADKTVKFWDFAVRKSGDGTSALTLQLARSLAVSDDVLSLCFSGDGKLLAVSLLDATVKVYYVDSLKLFLTLYGHKLPVLSISISSDSRLLISGSADKNVKVWGLDFGDCHKSMFAHEDSVTRVAFVPNTHYFITSSKDGTLKYWDADRYEHVTTLRGHASEVWCLAVSSVGDFLVSGSHDRSVRVWAQTEELLFPETERQKEMDALFAPSVHELQAASNTEKADLEVTAEGIAGLSDNVSGAAIQTLASLKHAERLTEAIELAFDERAKTEDWSAACVVAEEKLAPEEREAKRRKNAPVLPPPEKNPLLLGLLPDEYLRQTLTRIPLSELDTALALLTFSNAMQLLTFCSVWLSQGAAGLANAETVCRICFFLIRTHLRELSQAKKYQSLLVALRHLCATRLEQLRDCVAFNGAGALHIQRQLRLDKTAAEFFTVAKRLKDKESKRRKQEATRTVVY
jgi:U3 small nucleolar RNA-associated protein 12